MRKIIITCLLVCMVFTVSIYAAPVTMVFCWYSDSNNIAHWTSTPSISKIKLNNNVSFSFSDGYSHARTQWANAGIQTNDVGTSTSANIVCRGGTINELVAASGISASSLYGNNGVTLYSCSYQNDLFYGNEIKHLYQMSSASVYVIDNPLRTVNEIRKTTIHEVGHALGWLGHSSSASDIMYFTGSSIITLTSRDKNHLNQVY